VPSLESRLPDIPGHVDRCWLDAKDKRTLRMVDGRIGLGKGVAAG
jgi:hypothetical protein